MEPGPRRQPLVGFFKLWIPKSAGSALRLALYTRLIYLVVGFIFSKIAFSYDTSTSILLNILAKSGSKHNGLSESLLFLSNWDSHYFWPIAVNGYEFEQQMAFFPGIPALSRSIGSFLFGSLLDSYSYTLISGILLSYFSFGFSVYYLYSLTDVIFNNNSHYISPSLVSILYCINPAGLFLSAYYTEATFAFLSFFAMYHFELGRSLQINSNEKTSYNDIKSYSHFALATLSFALCSLIRSNGTVYSGFFLYFLILTWIKCLDERSLKSVIKSLILTASSLISCIIILFPTTVFQFYAFERICLISGDSIFDDLSPSGPLNLFNFLKSFYKMVCLLLGYKNNLSVSIGLDNAELLSNGYDCNIGYLTAAVTDNLPKFPARKYMIIMLKRFYLNGSTPYSFIQTKYWNIGLFNYWNSNEVGNFIIAAPFLVISFVGLYYKYNYLYKKLNCFNPTNIKTKLIKELYTNIKWQVINDISLPYFILWSLLLIILLTVSHVQIIVRLFTSIPSLYWTVIKILNYDNILVKRCILGYFLFYSIAMTGLFATFYPPA